MIKSYKYDSYLVDSASAHQEQNFKKQTHKKSTSSNHPHEQYSTASSSDSDGENQAQSQQGQQGNQDPHCQIQKDRYKTELCRNFQLNGSCNYGKKCQYAHGRHELQQKPERKTNQYYKTRPCKEFFNTFVCLYGQRCKYNHDIRNLNDLFRPSTFYQKKLATMDLPATSVQAAAASKGSRLSFFGKSFNSEVAAEINLNQTGAFQTTTTITSPSTFSCNQEQKKNDFFNKTFNKEINTSEIPLSAYLIFNESNPSLTLSNNNNNNICINNNNNNCNQKTFHQQQQQSSSLNPNFVSSNYFFSW